MGKKESDSQNVNMLTKSDRKLFELMYGKHKDAIYYYVLKRINSVELAEDFTADTFVKLYDNPDILRNRDANGVKAWLYTVARNMLIDHYRKNSKKDIIEFEDEVFEIFNSKDGEYLKEVIHDEDVKSLHKSIDRTLTSAEKEMVMLRFKDELQFSEIAEIVDKTEAAVKMAVYRALEKLKSNVDVTV